MKIWNLLKWLVAGITFGGQAFMSSLIGLGLPGRVRVLPPIYRRSDLEIEFQEYTLPDEALEHFDQAVQAQLNRDYQTAYNLYFSLKKVQLIDNAGYVNMPEGSAVVAWNVYVMYLATGQKGVAERYRLQSEKLQSEAQTK